MILSCNSCGKKFIVPDNAITTAGRLVQCSACGNKWKQFPIKKDEKKVTISKPAIKRTVTKPISSKKPTKSKRRVAKKTREINLYSPEYLAKKHGIKIKDNEPNDSKKSVNKEKVSFGFYSSLLVFFVFVIFISRTLFFAQSFIINIIPGSEFYLSYFFENIRNVFEIWKSLIASY